MTSYFFFFLASAGSFLLGRRSLTSGIGDLIAVGYAYGIVRANFVSTYTHLMFDGAVAGLYLARCSLRRAHRSGDSITIWPDVGRDPDRVADLLLAVSPGHAPLVELVGWRANVFLLPFLLLGAACPGTISTILRRCWQC